MVNLINDDFDSSSPDESGNESDIEAINGSVDESGNEPDSESDNQSDNGS